MYDTPKNTRISSNYKPNNMTPIFSKGKNDENNKKFHINLDLFIPIEEKLYDIL